MRTQQDGPGVSKIIPTSEDQDAIRRTKKAKQKHAGNGTRPSQTLIKGLREDQNEAKKKKFFDLTWYHLESFATRCGWSETELEGAKELLSSLIFGTEEPNDLIPRIEREVFRRFALGYLRNEHWVKWLQLPGCKHSSFPSFLEEAQGFYRREPEIPAQRMPDEAMATTA